MRYNCTILDLYDRSVIASVHGRNITAELGKKALEAAISQHPNTLKSELIYQHSYSSEDKLFADIDDYVLLWYNSVRPHSFNNGLTPWQKRMA